MPWTQLTNFDHKTNLILLIKVDGQGGIDCAETIVNNSEKVHLCIFIKNNKPVFYDIGTKTFSENLTKAYREQINTYTTINNEFLRQFYTNTIYERTTSLTF